MDSQSPTDLAQLTRLVDRLRGPDGCPWDREQSPTDVRAYLLEEAHEVAAAIDEGDWGAICGEVGDLLFQVAFLAHLGALDLGQAIGEVDAKMVARHPHVFGSDRLGTAAEVRRAWERRKASERSAGSHLDGVRDTLPALLAAYRLGQKAAGVGFDWPEAELARDKVHEELDELSEAIDRVDRAAIEEEVGDLLFSVANYSRLLGVEPEAALAAANRKFRSRFEELELEVARRGKRLGEVGLDELEAIWAEVKAKASAPDSDTT